VPGYRLLRPFGTEFIILLLPGTAVPGNPIKQACWEPQPSSEIR
jgi:hypothetical protein